MLTLFFFGEGESGREEDLRAALDRLADDALLWIALLDPSEDEVAAVQEAVELSDKQAERLLEQPSQASLVDAGEHMHVTLYAASSENGEPVLRSIECVIGSRWVVTAHHGQIEVLEDFRDGPNLGGAISRSRVFRRWMPPAKARAAARSTYVVYAVSVSTSRGRASLPALVLPSMAVRESVGAKRARAREHGEVLTTACIGRGVGDR